MTVVAMVSHPVGMKSTCVSSPCRSENCLSGERGERTKMNQARKEMNNIGTPGDPASPISYYLSTFRSLSRGATIMNPSAQHGPRLLGMYQAREESIGHLERGEWKSLLVSDRRRPPPRNISSLHCRHDSH